MRKKKRTEPKIKGQASSYPIVAIGASAGGLPAITELLNNLPSDTGMAFIYVQHLDPGHKSMLTDILSRTTKMIVQEIDDMDKIRPNHVFIIPPNKSIVVLDGHMKLISRSKSTSAVTIDILFTSLAEVQKERVIGIILSGSGSDGTQGMHAIKREGGLTFAQDDSAQFKSMPESAIATGAVDFVLSPKKIALELSRISKHRYVMARGKRILQEDLLVNDDPDLKNILRLLYAATKVDFSQYKMTTVKRRIIRRMLLHKIKTLKEFASVLSEKNGEIDLLYQDMLIHVTSFFRDPEPYKYLKSTFLPKLLKAKKKGETLRIWVPACASGEEVFSLAILLTEIQEAKGTHIPVNIFGSDLSVQSINKARKGIYTLQELESVSPQRLKRFFIKSNYGYRILNKLRELCVFAPQNILTDPPFSRLDFISCRNLFIYFDTAAQKKVIGTFHYALNDNGFLMLGKSETIHHSSPLFAEYNKSFKILIRKKNSDLRHLPSLAPQPLYTTPAVTDPDAIPNRTGAGIRNLDTVIDAVLLANYMPASVVITPDMEILQFRGSTRLYLEHPTGIASFNILNMARAGIGLDLRKAISEAVKKEKPVRKSGIEMKLRDKSRFVTLEVVPLTMKLDKKLLLVIFTEQEQFERFPEPVVSGKKNSTARDRHLKKLEDELASARAAATAIAMDQDSLNEELQSANAEAMSINEELQITNEELATSKEEIESTNEELRITNQELLANYEQLHESEERYHRLVEGIEDYAIIYLSPEGVIENWNKGAEKIKGYKSEEIIGKKFSIFYSEADIQNHLPEKILEQASRTGSAKHEGWKVRKDGSVFWGYSVFNALFDEHQNIFGFSKVTRDLTSQKEAENKIKEANFHLRNKTNQLLEAQQLAHIGSWEWDVPANKVEWSDEMYRIFGLRPQELEMDYAKYLNLVHPEDRERVNGIIQQSFQDQQPYKMLNKILHPDGNIRILSATGKVFTDALGNTIRMAGTAQDITEQKKYEAELIESEERFLKIFDKNPIAMSLSEIKTGIMRFTNEQFHFTFGYSKEEVIGYTSEELKLLSQDELDRAVGIIINSLQETRSVEELRLLSVDETEDLLKNLNRTEAMKNFEIEYTRKNGKTFPALVSYEILGIGNKKYTIASYQDITERKKIEELFINQNARLEKMNKELKAFAYVSSHDLQEPLRKIRIFSDRILENEFERLTSTGKFHFARMQLAAKRMQTLIDDLLAYSRASNENLKTELTAVNKIVEEVKEELKEDILQKQAIVEVGDLGHLNIIPFQFRQLLNNLICNSLKFSKPHEPPHITIKGLVSTGKDLKLKELAPQIKYYHLTVEDNGIGFEEQHRDKIFEVFQRLHGKEKFPGTGIGLSIVKKIVDNHQGFIKAKGEVNKGAIFEIFIPVT